MLGQFYGDVSTHVGFVAEMSAWMRRGVSKKRERPQGAMLCVAKATYSSAQFALTRRFCLLNVLDGTR